MQIIKHLAKQIKEELEDAEKYAKGALEYKATLAGLASVYHRLAEEELTHASMLHDEAVRMIQKASAEKAPPPVMMELWAWQHEEMIEEEAEVRTLLDMYKR